ncbi:ABC transporter permease [Ghiorsea bivora]|uniref:ABC transporter permease n=1 Tax=Ghiorsea bivora TaxID=1485545 RepID=UPI00068ABBAA|nr:ABC transporter permease [Ghiorsea bivora]
MSLFKGIPQSVYACLFLPALVLLIAALQNMDGHAVDLHDVLQGTSTAHWLGTDVLGRDILSRLAEGVTLSFSVAISVITLCAIIGISVGMIAAWLGGWVDSVLMRFVDIVLSFPGILLAIALAAVLGPGVDKLIIALAAVGWVGFARLTRAQVLSLRHAPYIEAAIASGQNTIHIATKHLLPNIAAPLLIEASFGIAAVMIGEAGLSFLGIGIQPPDASLGTMIREGSQLMLVAPMQVVYPGLMLFLLVMSANLAGDALRDYLDVRSKR